MYIINVFDPKIWDVWLTGTPLGVTPIPTAKAKTKCIKEGADLCFNFALFNLGDKRTVDTHFVKNGQRISYGNPPLITVGESVVGGYTTMLGGKRTRNAFGLLSDGRYFVAQTSHSVTEKTFETYVMSYLKLHYKEVKVFLFEDGGASTQAYSNRSKLIFAPEGGRAVPTHILVKAKVPLKITRNLAYGSSGPDVRLLQQILGGIQVDGLFGRGTESRLALAQKNLKIMADGKCGPITRKALGLNG